MLKYMKKFILVAILFAAVLVIGCGDSKETKVNPSISNGDQVYVSMTEDNVTYKVLNQKVYAELKASVGVNTLINLIAEDLLKEYLDKYEAKDDSAVKEAIDKDIYGEDFDFEDKEAVEKAKKEFLDSVFLDYGINTTNEYDQLIQDIYKLDLAKKDYAKVQLEKEIKEHDEAYNEWVEAGEDENDEDAVKTPYFTEGDFVQYYQSNNEDKYWTIIVPFDSQRAFEIALQQKGIKLNDNNEWTKDGKQVTEAEAAKVFVELYNEIFGKNVALDVDASKVTEDSEFYYSASDLSSVSSKLVDFIKYDEENEANNVKYTTTPVVLNAGELKVIFYNIKQVPADKYEDLDEAAKKAADEKALASLKEDEITTTYINNKIYELFAEKNLVIYDTVLENSYKTNISKSNVEYKGEGESTTLVAKVDGFEYSADELFKAMDKVSGVTIALSELTYQRFLNNKEINKYYDVASKKWLDKDLQEDIEDAIKAEKDSFNNGTYKEYGYDPDKMTFKNFIELVYSAKSEDDLLLTFLYSEIVTKYSSGLIGIEDSNSTIWADVVEKIMSAKASEFFSVKGVHLLVQAYESKEDMIYGNSAKSFEEWTPEQKTAGEKLAKEVIEYVKASQGTYQARLQKVQEAFELCPYTAGDAEYNGTKVSTTLVSDDGKVVIDVLKYKNQGLSVKYEDLGSFNNGKMVEEFENVVFDIWKEEVEKSSEARKPRLYDKGAIQTEFGYHVYANLEVTEQTVYTEKDGDKEVDYTYPNIDQVKAYLKDADKVDSTLKTLITTYYTPLSKEISGQYLTYVLQYKAIEKALEADAVKFTGYSDAQLEVVNKLIDINVENWLENNLQYIDAEYVDYFLK